MDDFKLFSQYMYVKKQQLTWTFFPGSVDFPSDCCMQWLLFSSLFQSVKLAKKNFNKTYDILLLHKKKCNYSLIGIWKKRSMSDLSDYFGNVFQGLFDGILCQIPLESCQVGYHIHYLTN